MSTVKLQEPETMIGHDEQGKLVLQLTALAHKINQAGIAEVHIQHQKHSLLVVVRNNGWTGAERFNKPLGLALPSEGEFARLRMLYELRSAVYELEKILAQGMAPTDGAA